MDLNIHFPRKLKMTKLFLQQIPLVPKEKTINISWGVVAPGFPIHRHLSVK